MSRKKKKEPRSPEHQQRLIEKRRSRLENKLQAYQANVKHLENEISLLEKKSEEVEQQAA